MRPHRWSTLKTPKGDVRYKVKQVLQVNGETHMTLEFENGTTSTIKPTIKTKVPAVKMRISYEVIVYVGDRTVTGSDDVEYIDAGKRGDYAEKVFNKACEDYPHNPIELRMYRPHGEWEEVNYREGKYND